MSHEDLSTLARTPLHALHVELGARMVPFAGYAMPVQYPAGVLAEHKHTRAAAGLFDVSHMGQVELRGADAAKALEALVPGDITGSRCGAHPLHALHQRHRRHSRRSDGHQCRTTGCSWSSTPPARTPISPICVQAWRKASRSNCCPIAACSRCKGRRRQRVLDRLAPGAAAMGFMSARPLHIAGIPCFVTRSGYTGEDGFEISVPGDRAEALARRMLAEPEVAPVGLGARDTLRLEAGLCLYGSDIGTATTPVEAALAWTISKRRREQGGFPGDAVIRRQMAEGPSRLRVGIKPADRAPARGHTPIVGEGDLPVGEVTSGGFGPTVDGPIAMGYVRADLARTGTALGLMVRGARRPASVDAAALRRPPLPQAMNRGAA